jgi:hypothetical protein
MRSCKSGKLEVVLILRRWMGAPKSQREEVMSERTIEEGMSETAEQ